ncbi:hypothetical protein, partial [Haloquadratum walsbyi]|uniref:hypothetical protein n=1 Tax=Haloquadratum walsbyi TaxID=293091 RepID=UPI0023F11B56
NRFVSMIVNATPRVPAIIMIAVHAFYIFNIFSEESTSSRSEPRVSGEQNKGGLVDQIQQYRPVGWKTWWR